MNNEIPKEKPANAENELSEDEQQAHHENACRECFIRDWIQPSPLSPEQKLFVAEFIYTNPGPWRHYNGEDFRVVKQEVEGGFWNVSFGVYFEEYEAERIDVAIPLS